MNESSINKNIAELRKAAGMTQEQLAKKLMEKLPGRCVLWGGSLLDSLGAIEGLNKCDSVVLVERCGVSRYSLVKCQVETVQPISTPKLPKVWRRSDWKAAYL